MKNRRIAALVVCALLAVPILGRSQVPVVGPSTFAFTAGSQSNVWTCNGGQSSFALTVPSGLTGVFTVTVSQTSSGTYINPPNAFAPGSTTYANTITNSGSLTVALGANAYVKVADTTYSSGSSTVSGVCSASSPSGPSAASAVPTPIPWTTASPAPVSCVAVAAVGTCATPIPWSQASPLPISLPTSFPGNFPTPIPFATSSALPGSLRNVQAGPSTAPAASNGGYDSVVDVNGRTATRICDATTSTQCQAITSGGVASVHDAAPVQPSPLYTMPVSLNTSAPLPVSTPSANPLPTASAGVAPPANAPHVVAWMTCVTSAGSAPVTTAGNGQAALCPNGILQVNTPVPAATSPAGYQLSTNVGPSTAPAAVNSTYQMVVDSNGRQATRICDGTTSTQCIAITAGGIASTHDAAPVQPSPLYTIPVTTPVPYATATAGIIAHGYSANGPTIPIICSVRTVVSIAATSAPTVVIASAAGKTTYVCSVSAVATGGTAGQFASLRIASSNSCTAETTAMPLVLTSPGAVANMGSGVGTIYSTGSGFALCLDPGTGSPSVTLEIMTEQF